MILLFRQSHALFKRFSTAKRALFFCLTVGAVIQVAPGGAAENGANTSGSDTAFPSTSTKAAPSTPEKVPPPSASAEATEEREGLDRSVIEDVIFSHSPAVKHCYNRELGKDPTLAGVVVVTFTISAKGNISSAAVKSSSLENKEVESCLVSEVKTWIFPEPQGGGTVDVAYPFKFKPVD